MLFNSLHFLFFFPIVIGLYHYLPGKFRGYMLLLASYYFYGAWKLEYLSLIVISTLVDYYCAQKIEQSSNERIRKGFLYTSLAVNLGLLFSFKYLNFFSSNISEAINFFGINYDLPIFDIILPVGISFYTFQTLSYTIDVYRRDISAEKNLATFALYVSYWPQLVAGPIERPGHLIPELKTFRDIDIDNVRIGLMRMSWGFFKKLVIADRVSAFVNEIYNSPNGHDGSAVLLASYFFAFQIYCDFSGYSDIAIGASKVMGIDLMENFRRPYFSKSISEFWRRWHISLSTWFRDYVYIPLGGNRVVKWKRYYNLFITFLVSGIWHGANWTFVAWGALHGLMLVLAIVKNNKLDKLLPNRNQNTAYQLWQIVFTFHLAVFGWVFFRANHIGDVGTLLASFGSFDFGKLMQLLQAQYLGVLFVAALIVVEAIMERKDSHIDFVVHLKSRLVRWIIYLVIFAAICWFGKFTNTDFIYFQF